MISIRKMKKEDIPILYAIAKRAFQPDYEKFGVYPPMMNVKKETFSPPRSFGKTVIIDDCIAGGAFVLSLGRKGELGALFLDPSYHGKGYGKKLLLLIEQTYPKVKKWRLDTPAENEHLHGFYESLGYVKTKEIMDKKSGISGFVYEKIIV